MEKENNNDDVNVNNVNGSYQDVTVKCSQPLVWTVELLPTDTATYLAKTVKQIIMLTFFDNVVIIVVRTIISFFRHWVVLFFPFHMGIAQCPKQGRYLLTQK